MKKSIHLAQIISAVVENQPSDQDLHTLYHIVSELAYRILKKKVFSKNYYFNVIHSDENYLRDEAISVVATLFRTNKEGKLEELVDYFLTKMHRIQECPEEALHWLKRLVASKMRQELIHRFKQEDIEGFRLYRNLMLAPNRHAKIGKFTLNYRQYYYYDDGKPQCDIYNKDHEPVTREILNGWLDLMPMEKEKTPTLLLKILRRCRQEERLQNYIAFSLLLSCLKTRSCTHLFEYNDGQMGKGSPISINKYERKMLTLQIRAQMEEILNFTYIQHYKVTNGERKIYLTIVMEYFNDLIHTGEVKLLPQYLERIPNKHELNGDWQQHRSRIEYMIKLGKKYLQEIIIPI